jgi:hypothetical protein
VNKRFCHIFISRTNSTLVSIKSEILVSASHIRFLPPERSGYHVVGVVVLTIVVDELFIFRVRAAFDIPIFLSGIGAKALDRAHVQVGFQEIVGVVKFRPGVVEFKAVHFQKIDGAYLSETCVIENKEKTFSDVLFWRSSILSASVVVVLTSSCVWIGICSNLTVHVVFLDLVDVVLD